MYAGPAGDQARPVQRLELVEVRGVDDAGDHLVRVERCLQVRRDDAEQFVVAVLGWPYLGVWLRALLAPVQPRDDAPTQAQRVRLVNREVVAEAGRTRVHLGAAEGFVVGLLAGGHLDQWRAAEEHLRAILDHDGVIAHRRNVGATCGRVAEHDRDSRDARRRETGQVAEHRPAGDEDLLLAREIRATRLDQGDHRQPVLQRNLVRPQGLLQRPRVARPATHRRIVRRNKAFDALDDADADDQAGADLVVAAPSGQWRQFEERRVGVEQ